MNKSSMTAAGIVPTPGFHRALASLAGALALAASGMAQAGVTAQFDAIVAIDGSSKDTARTNPGSEVVAAIRGCRIPGATRASSPS